MTSTRPVGADYELTVVGELGPALRALVEPVTAASSSGQLTILCLRGHDDQDLVDILDIVRSHGLETTTISAIG